MKSRLKTSSKSQNQTILENSNFRNSQNYINSQKNSLMLLFFRKEFIIYAFILIYVIFPIIIYMIDIIFGAEVSNIFTIFIRLLWFPLLLDIILRLYLWFVFAIWKIFFLRKFLYKNYFIIIKKPLNILKKEYLKLLANFMWNMYDIKVKEFLEQNFFRIRRK